MSKPHWTDSVYEEVTAKIIAQLEQGTIPWRKPWATSCQPAQNLVSRKAYRGINAIVLGFSEFASPYWATFNQVRSLGGNVIRGSKSSLVVFYKLVEKKDAQGRVMYSDSGRPLGFPMLRYSRVFNAEQCEGLTLPATPEPAAVQDADEAHLESARQVADAWKDCPVQIIGTSACYSPSLDQIRMPAMESFDCKASFYHTLFHEMGHATGHGTRLDREGITAKDARFGSDVYSKEELIAEFTASFVGNITGILDQVQLENSAAYVANWLKVLKDDRKLIVAAASAGQRAADYILRDSAGQEDESK
jgi:antirestriction protein ArdC